MPRKKPYSNKQKKKQLQDKRRRKQDIPNQYGEREDQSDSDTISQPDVSSAQGVQKINLQPGHQSKKKHDSNRYRLHFSAENPADVEKRKQLARQPLQRLPEAFLEDDIALHLDPDMVLDIPKRPPWDYTLSKQRLERNEKRYFEEYLSQLRERATEAKLSYFEMNLETWRQLWRVLEMSDILLLITDIRHPTLNFSPALYNHITEELKKPIILILNKADLAPPQLVVAWQHYFRQKFPLVNVIVFTSFPKDRQELETTDGETTKAVQKKRKKGKFKAVGPRELHEVCLSLVKDRVDLSSWGAKIEEDQQELTEDEVQDEKMAVTTDDDLDISYHQHEEFKDGVLTIGCVGYPNVGKSSVINGLMGKKVVSVSRSPGHTKHFQTIYLTPSVRLCDCPGLVFPSFVDRNLQILAGSYPVAQVQEPYTPVGFLAQRLNLPTLLQLRHPGDGDEDRSERPQWSAFDICDAFAEKRGFLTAKAARHDTYRAANYLLRMAVDGRLCLCFTPPGYTQSKEHWSSHPDTQRLRDLQVKYRQQTQAGKSDTEDSSSDEEISKGRQLSEDDADSEEETSHNNVSFTSSNPFDLLSEDGI